MSPTPSGLFHDVPIEDLFFSTTDAKGVIDEANEVFARNSRYERSELLGAPHNIIRHPDMPGAVFKATWDLLGAGHPVCAYVKNLARDGSTYWAFATIVPIAGRFLSKPRSQPGTPVPAPAKRPTWAVRCSGKRSRRTVSAPTPNSNWISSRSR